MKKLVLLTSILSALMAVFLLQSCKSSSGSEARLLQFNLEKGKGYTYDMVWDMDQQIMGQENKITMTAVFSMNVTDDDGKIKTVATTYDRFGMNMKMMGMDMDIDTDKPAPVIGEEEMKTNPGAIMQKAFSGIKGKTVIMKVDEKGNILSVTGFEEILNSVVDSVSLGEEIKMQMRAALKDQFSEQQIKDQFAQVLNIFPEKAVKVGESWERSFATGGRMPAQFTTTYTVKEMKGDMVTLDAKTKISSPDKAAEMQVSGTQTATMIIDGKTGLITSSDFVQDMKAKVSGMEMVMKSKGKIKGKAN